MSNDENINNHIYIYIYFDFTDISIDILIQNIDESKIDQNFWKKKNS